MNASFINFIACQGKDQTNYNKTYYEQKLTKDTTAPSWIICPWSEKR